MLFQSRHGLQWRQGVIRRATRHHPPLRVGFPLPTDDYYYYYYYYYY
jgi:hypothetical protein